MEKRPKTIQNVANARKASDMRSVKRAEPKIIPPHVNTNIRLTARRAEVAKRLNPMKHMMGSRLRPQKIMK